MYQRILVPLDGSKRAEQAFPVAIRIAHATGASLTLLRIVEPPIEFEVGPDIYSQRTKDPNEQLAAEIERSRAYLLHVLEESDLEGIGIATEVRTGVVAQNILQCAAEHHDDLIVMCSHGTTGLKRWLLGSVAQKIAHSSPIPVLIVREGHPLPTGQQGVANEPFRILVPLDGSALSETALMPAAQLCAAFGEPGARALHLVQVVEPVAVMGDLTGAMAELNQEAEVKARQYLKEMEQRLQEGPYASFQLAVTSEVVPGIDVATVLLNIAKEGKSAGEQGKTDGSRMIAMSTHGRQGISYWVIGSVAERVLGATTLPMLIVRPAKEQVQQKQEAEKQQAAF